jgi:hypothetical protein
MPSNVHPPKLDERLRLIRIEIFGLSGTAEIARQLGIPERTWCNYELGVTVPGEILLKFILLTSVDPYWLANGVGPVTLGNSPGLSLSLPPKVLHRMIGMAGQSAEN